MNTKTILSIFILLSLTIVSCVKDKKDTPEPVQVTASQYTIFNFIDDVMDTVYFWNDMIPEKGDRSLRKPDEYFNSYLTYYLDRYSAMIKAAAFTDELEEGNILGFGFNLNVDQNSNIVVEYVYDNSSAYNSGVRRGMVLKSINNNVLTEDGIMYLYYGNEGDVVELGFEIDNNIYNTTLIRNIFEKEPLLAETIYYKRDYRIGYLAFENFYTYSQNSIEQAFANFKNEQISDLIIDLRYNGGGLLDMQKQISEMILPFSYNNEVYSKIIHNDIMGNMDTTLRLNIDASKTLSLNRLFVITGSGSASASEGLINCMKPFCEVITIGETTYGKPVGMYTIDYEEWMLLPISFLMVNSNNEGDYYNGIYPNHYVYDDYNYELGDENETAIKSALQYILTGSFGTGAIALKQGSTFKKITPPNHNIFIYNRASLNKLVGGR